MIGGEIAAPQAGVQRLRLGLQDLGDDLGVVGLEQFRPGLADDFDVGREALQVGHELAGGVAAVGIVGRAGRPLLQALGLGDRGGIAAADDRIVDALAAVRNTFGMCCFGSAVSDDGFRVGVDAEHAEIARHFVHGEGAGRGLGVDQKLAAVGVDELARDAGRLPAAGPWNRGSPSRSAGRRGRRRR